MKRFIAAPRSCRSTLHEYTEAAKAIRLLHRGNHRGQPLLRACLIFPVLLNLGQRIVNHAEERA
jgi:hypothetical protein